MNPLDAAIVLANALSTWFLAGLIWTIQVVHYPLFDRVGRAGFVSYETAHAQLITLVVGPAMLVEILAATAMVALRPKAVPAWAAWTGLALVAVIWGSTAFVQVPMHTILGRGFDAEAHAHLVSTNWIRTVAWSARAALLAWCIWNVLCGADASTPNGASA